MSFGITIAHDCMGPFFYVIFWHVDQDTMFEAFGLN